MRKTTDGLRQAAAFAGEAGVSVRTLHLYDHMGLLPPAAFTAAGYRLYGDAELERLEQILALRFVGLPLERIKALLGDVSPAIEDALAMQREAIVHQRERLDAALSAIDRARTLLKAQRGEGRRKILHDVIEVLKMENDWKWTHEYYSAEALEAIAQRRAEMGKEAIEQGERDWTTLIAEVERAAAEGADPRGERGRTLARRWRELIEAFTGNNEAVHSGASALWSDRTHWPAEFERPWSDAAQTFISAAMSAG